MAAFGQINSFNSTFFKGGNPFINKTVCDYIDTSLFNYTQYVYTSTNKTGTFYLNPTVNTTVYILAIGGGGGGHTNGGGGGGGFVEASYVLLANDSIFAKINIGSGGTAGNYGKNTTLIFKKNITTITAYGGGSGNNGNGASGGGTTGLAGYIPGTTTLIEKIQGYNANNGNGGGAGGPAINYTPGIGKNPISESFNKNKYYSSGGCATSAGKFGEFTSMGLNLVLPGGGGGGELRNTTTIKNATSGLPNTGGGGGGSKVNSGNSAGEGGSGIVIISIKNQPNDFFRDIYGNMFLSSSIDNNYYLFSFTSSGSFTLNNDASNCNCLIVGGGGAGGFDLINSNSGGGGGAGQVVVVNNLSLSANTKYDVTVGLGAVKSYSPYNVVSNNNITNGKFSLPLLTSNTFLYCNSFTTTQKNEFYWTYPNIPSVAILNGNNPTSWKFPTFPTTITNCVALQSDATNTGYIQQTFSLLYSGVSQLSFYWAGRYGYSPGELVNLQVLINNTSICDISNTSVDSWTLVSINVSINNGNNTIKFIPTRNNTGIGIANIDFSKIIFSGNNNITVSNSGTSSLINTSNTINISAIGGGNGAYYNFLDSIAGSTGGSGGGGTNLLAGGNASTYTNTINISYYGNNGSSVNGGGGGAMSVGVYRNTSSFFSGGDGYIWPLNGVSYGGGGACENTNLVDSLGGSMVGGDAMKKLVSTGQSYDTAYWCDPTNSWGKINSGGGGAGYFKEESSCHTGLACIGNGGSGIVIIAIPKTYFSQSFQNTYNTNNDYRIGYISSNWLIEYGYRNSLYTFSDVSNSYFKNMYTNDYDLKETNSNFVFCDNAQRIFTSLSVKYMNAYPFTTNFNFILPHKNIYSKEFSMFVYISEQTNTNNNFTFSILNNNDPNDIYLYLSINTKKLSLVFLPRDSNGTINGPQITKNNLLTLSTVSTVNTEIGITINSSGLVTIYNWQTVKATFTIENLNCNFFDKNAYWNLSYLAIKCGPIATYAKCLSSTEYVSAVTNLFV